VTHETFADAAASSPYLTADEAAAYLRYANVRALYKAVAALNIPCRRRGGKTFLFHRGELEAWLRGASHRERQSDARARQAEGVGYQV
jgi:excisionase family DNA binding protein